MKDLDAWDELCMKYSPEYHEIWRKHRNKSHIFTLADIINEEFGTHYTNKDVIVPTAFSMTDRESLTTMFIAIEKIIKKHQTKLYKALK